jgi:hypothetical protein
MVCDLTHPYPSELEECAKRKNKSVRAPIPRAMVYQMTAPKLVRRRFLQRSDDENHRLQAKQGFQSIKTTGSCWRNQHAQASAAACSPSRCVPCCAFLLASDDAHSSPHGIAASAQDRADETAGRCSRIYLYSCHVSQITTMSNSVISKSQMEWVKLYL